MIRLYDWEVSIFGATSWQRFTLRKRKKRQHMVADTYAAELGVTEPASGITEHIAEKRTYMYLCSRHVFFAEFVLHVTHVAQVIKTIEPKNLSSRLPRCNIETKAYAQRFHAFIATIISTITCLRRIQKHIARLAMCQGTCHIYCHIVYGYFSKEPLSPGRDAFFG